jgi:hypothetical protein
MKKLSRREVMGAIGAAGAGGTLAGMTEAAELGRGQPAFNGRAEGGGGVEGVTDRAFGF